MSHHNCDMGAVLEGDPEVLLNFPLDERQQKGHKVIDTMGLGNHRKKPLDREGKIVLAHFPFPVQGIPVFEQVVNKIPVVSDGTLALLEIAQLLGNSFGTDLYHLGNVGRTVDALVGHHVADTHVIEVVAPYPLPKLVNLLGSGIVQHLMDDRVEHDGRLGFGMFRLEGANPLPHLVPLGGETDALALLTGQVDHLGTNIVANELIDIAENVTDELEQGAVGASEIDKQLRFGLVDEITLVKEGLLHLLGISGHVSDLREHRLDKKKCKYKDITCLCCEF